MLCIGLVHSYLVSLWLSIVDSVRPAGLQIKGVAPEHVIGVLGGAYIVGLELPNLRSVVSSALLSTSITWDIFLAID